MSNNSWIRTPAVLAAILLPLAGVLAACAPRPAPNADLARELTGFGTDQPARPNAGGSSDGSRSGDH